MTVATEQRAVPQDEPTTGRGLEALVQSLARRAFAEQAKELSDRAKAAEENSRKLAERVALLEGADAILEADDDNKLKAEDDASTYSSYDYADTETEPTLLDGRGERTIPLPVSNHRVDGDSDKNDGDLSDWDAGIGLSHTRKSNQDDEKERIHDNKYKLPDSTFSLLITEHPKSLPFFYAAFSIILSITCLCLTLASSIQKGTRFNRIGVPEGVTGIVVAAQFLGALVGVLMEDEVPQGLQFIANVIGNKLLLDGKKEVQMRVLLSSVVRLIIGYLFLSSLFINIAQNSDVLEIFYDVLALEFVENIDDTAFALAKRGFFGRRMLVATLQKHTLEIPGRKSRFMMEDKYLNGRRSSHLGRSVADNNSIVSNTRTTLLVRLVYFLNVAIVLAGLSYITVSQKNGKYRCSTITVTFDEEIWEDAYVQLPNGNVEERLLIYSHFNGIYKEAGLHGGYPKYIEQNKIAGSLNGDFESITGAEIIYCSAINAWVFVHPSILLTSPDGDREEGNECSWLWRSPETDDFDLISTTTSPWIAWVGEIKPLAQVSMICNECVEKSDCSYHGSCIERTCICDDLHFGENCEFEMPCQSLASEKAQEIDPENGVLKWNQENPIKQINKHMVYNRPVYIQKGLSGEPYNMRLYKIREPDKELMPSSQPSDLPSISKVPSSVPSKSPSQSPSSSPTPVPSTSPTKTIAPTNSLHPTIKYYDTKRTYSSSDTAKGGGSGYSKASKSSASKSSSSKASKYYTPNNYETAPDFADWDDFFESKALHAGLEELLKDYSVIITYTGSRFYGTIVEPDATFGELFPPDYHAFWSQSFDINRTFIISDTTVSANSPVGIDFFEMRRRINTLLNPNVHFSYSPFGALIPLMNYDGTGFFHCFDLTTRPSASPSASSAPTLSPQECAFKLVVNILTDCYPEEVSWSLFRVSTIGEDNLLLESSEEYLMEDSLYSHNFCLQEGKYEFIINDSYGDGLTGESPGHYNLTSNGALIAQGGDFGDSETNIFSIPLTLAPSVRPSSSTPPTYKCWDTSVNLKFDRWPEDISWTIYRISSDGTMEEKAFVMGSGSYEDVNHFSLRTSDVCLQEGEYQFTIVDSFGDGIRSPGYYEMFSNGELIFRGDWFRRRKTYSFTIPILSKPSSNPSSRPSPSPSEQSESPSFQPSAELTYFPSILATLRPQESRLQNSSPWMPPTSLELCNNTPGYVDIYGDGCEYYEAEANYPQACQYFGEIGDTGNTPNTNCCVCKESAMAATRTSPHSDGRE